MSNRTPQPSTGDLFHAAALAAGLDHPAQMDDVNVVTLRKRNGGTAWRISVGVNAMVQAGIMTKRVHVQAYDGAIVITAEPGSGSLPQRCQAIPVAKAPPATFNHEDDKTAA